MASQTVEQYVDGGKASAAPPLGPALGPLGVNIGQVVQDINKKTEAFKGMKVPVKLVVDEETKEYEITVGTPPAAALIKKEAGIDKGSGNPLADKVADIKIPQVIKIAKMKEDALSGKTLKEKVNEVLGSCNSMGVMVEGKQAREVIADIKNGAFADEIAQEKTELSAEELKAQEAEKKRLAEELKKKRAEFEAAGKKVLEENEGKERSVIKAKLVEAGIPTQLINELLPQEGAAAAAAPAKPEEKKE